MIFEKVKCRGYLKEVPTKYVYVSEKYREGNNDCLVLGDEEEIYQETRKVVEKVFEGVIVGTKKISTENCYQQATRNVYDLSTLGFVGEELTDEIMVIKTTYIDCYKVYYGNNKSRLVPVEMVESEE